CVPPIRTPPEIPTMRHRNRLFGRSVPGVCDGAYAAGVGTAGMEAGMAGDRSEASGLAGAGRAGRGPEGIDLTTPSVARAYDYALGGSHSFAVDREYCRAMEAVFPEVRAAGRANRAFLHRAVRFLVEAGIRQFLDIGSGIPTVGNVHEIA